MEPGSFRVLHSFIQEATDRQGRIEVLAFAVQGGNAAAEDFTTTSGSSLPPSWQSPATVAAAAKAAAAAAAGGERESASTSAGAAAAAAASAAPGWPAGAAPPAAARRMGAREELLTSLSEVVYRGSIPGMPEVHASRKERFAELEGLQQGWEVELRKRGDTVDAVFFAPGGEKVGSYANARRMALQAAKQRAQ